MVHSNNNNNNKKQTNKKNSSFKTKNKLEIAILPIPVVTLVQTLKAEPMSPHPGSLQIPRAA